MSEVVRGALLSSDDLIARSFSTLSGSFSFQRASLSIDEFLFDERARDLSETLINDYETYLHDDPVSVLF